MVLYVPAVKAKTNDIQAIASLSELAIAQVKPLFEPPITIDDKKASTDASKAASLLLKNLPDVPFYFDPLSFEAEFRQISAIESLARAGKRVTPTFGVHRLPSDVALLRRVVHFYGLAMGARIELQDISQSPEETWTEILEYSARLDLESTSVELLLDLQYLHRDRVLETKESILDFLTLQPKGFPVGSLTVIGSSALASVASVEIDGCASIERLERQLWAEITYELGGTREIRFGDYGVINPNFVFSGPNPNANAKVRYTQGSAHHIFRGHGLYNPSRFEQYHELAARVVGSDCFMGKSFSYGDRYIAACAAGECGPGNLGTWVKVDTNHHLEFVARQTQSILCDIDRVSSTADLKELLVAT